MEANCHFLICTVGGTADPVIAAIREWTPARVLLIPSKETAHVADRVEQAGRDSGLVPPGAWDRITLTNPEDFGDCVRLMRGLDEKVAAWQEKGSTYDVVVDFTAGTKCMSAALVVVAHRWPCRFSYIGGLERTKGGVGVVVEGKEQLRTTVNPWNALGYQAIEEACLLFDQQAFMPAAKILEQARNAADERSVKRTLSTLHQLCEGYGLWDQFRHQEAAQRLADALTNASDLHAMFGSTRSEPVIGALKQHRETLRNVVTQPRSGVMIADLLANAKRRKYERRYDDGVARLYRAIEAIAQVRLHERHGIQSTDNVPLESVPEPLRQRWESRASEGRVALGLQDAYELLYALGDPLGSTFKDLGLHDRQRSPLMERNRSVLAHGFRPVGEVVFNGLWDDALKLSGISDGDLPAFPRLTGGQEQRGRSDPNAGHARLRDTGPDGSEDRAVRRACGLLVLRRTAPELERSNLCRSPEPNTVSSLSSFPRPRRRRHSACAGPDGE